MSLISEYSLTSLSDECVFCLEEMGLYDQARLDCNHKYHYHCIQQWTNTTKNYTRLCPQCNIPGEIVNITSVSNNENNENKKDTIESKTGPQRQDDIDDNLIASCCTIL